jgi:hypothetical protein
MKDRMADTILSKLPPNNGKGYKYVENEDGKESNQLSTAKEAKMPDVILSADDDDVLSIEKLLTKLGISIDDLRKMITQKDSMDMKPPPIENIASSSGSMNGVSIYTIKLICQHQ